MKHENVYIPDGITFGSRVLVIPNVLIGLSHSGFLSEAADVGSYAWVDRGDTIATFTLRRRRSDIPVVRWFTGEEAHSVSIQSPASGLVLHRGFEFCSTAESSRTALLLPDDEPAAKNGRFLYESLYQLCWAYKSTYLQPSRYWGMQGFEVEALKALLEQQVSVQCQYVDAMPRYKDYFDAARTKHPSLRPYLKHLLSAT
ncbi:MAG: hypothetical protein ACR2PZ_17470 [Pseudomonadales bacterium]